MDIVPFSTAGFFERDVLHLTVVTGGAGFSVDGLPANIRTPAARIVLRPLSGDNAVTEMIAMYAAAICGIHTILLADHRGAGG